MPSDLDQLPDDCPEMVLTTVSLSLESDERHQENWLSDEAVIKQMCSKKNQRERQLYQSTLISMIKESRIDHHQRQTHKPELPVPIKAAIKQFQSEFPQTACITLSIMRLGIRRRCVNEYRFQSVFLVTENYRPMKFLWGPTTVHNFVSAMFRILLLVFLMGTPEGMGPLLGTIGNNKTLFSSNLEMAHEYLSG